MADGSIEPRDPLAALAATGLLEQIMGSFGEAPDADAPPLKTLIVLVEGGDGTGFQAIETANVRGFMRNQTVQDGLSFMPEDGRFALRFHRLPIDDVEVIAEALGGTAPGQKVDALLEGLDAANRPEDFVAHGQFGGLSRPQVVDVLNALGDAWDQDEAQAETASELTAVDELERISEEHRQELRLWQQRYHELAAQVEALQRWQDVAAQGYDRMFAYLQAIDPTLTAPRGMPVDDVRYVIERLRNPPELEAPAGTLRLLRMLSRDTTKSPRSMIQEFGDRSAVVQSLRFLETVGVAYPLCGAGWALTPEGAVFAVIHEACSGTELSVAEEALYEADLLHTTPMNDVVVALEALSHARLIHDLGGRWSIRLQEGTN